MTARRCWAAAAALLLGLLVTSLRAGAAETLTAADAEQLERRMATWVQALRDNDTAAFLACYSKARPSRYENTLASPRRIDRIAYGRLAADLGGRTGWYEVFFDAGGDDVFRDHVKADGGKRWRRKGTTFTPPQADAAGHVFVRWRREGGTWVVDSVAEPSG